MRCLSFLFAVGALASLGVCAQTVVRTPAFNVTNLPDHWQRGQTGTNACGKFGASSPKSSCQNIFVNSVDDFCLYAPPSKNKTVGDSEQIMVAYCTKAGYGTRLIPDDTLTGVHFLRTNSFVQVTGRGNMTKINIRKGDEGGELDPHGYNGLGNPIGGLVWTRSAANHSGEWTQIKEWNQFISDTDFSLRACWGPNATQYCPHIYDEMGSYFNEPGDYRKHSFDECDGDAGQFPGVYGTSTFWQGQSHTPDPHPPGATSNCHTFSSVHNGIARSPLFSAHVQSRRMSFPSHTL